jgi:hypothetical protein
LRVFLIDIVEGGVQLSPLGTAGTNMPIVPALVHYDDEEIGRIMIGGGNRSTGRKPGQVRLRPPQTPHACQDENPGPPRWATARPTLQRMEDIHILVLWVVTP